MTPLTAARLQMEVSLAFHMVFAALGIGLPLMLLIAEGLWLRTGKPHYRELARTWAKATALTFAVGAVSGTALSFELGLLWPKFMAENGATLSGAFTLEGFAFFIEAIFIGLYLYGWDRLSPLAHWLTTIPIALSGLASGILVVAANAWMQAPTSPVGLATADPLAPFRSPAWGHMALHSSLSCYTATAFAAAGVYAIGILRGRNNAYHRAGLAIAMFVGVPFALAMPLSGDVSARAVAELQPIKLAAAEAHFRTEANAPLTIGGWPDETTEEVRYAIRIPGGLSFLAHHDVNATVIGLDAVPPDERPNVLITHLAFQTMVGAGFALIALAIAWLILWKRKRHLNRRFLWLILLASPLGFLALQTGWIVTEVGRQPWIVYGQMRTADAVTTVNDVVSTLIGFSVLYVALGTALVYLLLQLGKQHRDMPADDRAHENARV